MRGYQKNLHYIQDTQPRRAAHLDARNHYPQIKHHTPPPKQGNNKNPPPPTNPGAKGRHPPLNRGRPAGLLSQSPIVCLAVIFDQETNFPEPDQLLVLSSIYAPDPHPLQVRGHPQNRPGIPEPPHDVGRP